MHICNLLDKVRVIFAFLDFVGFNSQEHAAMRIMQLETNCVCDPQACQVGDWPYVREELYGMSITESNLSEAYPHP